jgi:hypothetical protein
MKNIVLLSQNNVNISGLFNVILPLQVTKLDLEPRKYMSYKAEASLCLL